MRTYGSKEEPVIICQKDQTETGALIPDVFRDFRGASCPAAGSGCEERHIKQLSC